MKIKSFKNNKEKQLIISDIVIVILCILNNGKNILNLIFTYIKIIYELNVNILSGILMFIFIFVFVIISIVIRNYIIIIIYLSFRILRKKAIKTNKKYEEINDIKYYRDILVGITPSEISLIADLEIEYKKDIIATMIDLYQRNVIDFDNNKVVIKKEDDTLRKSEKKLIDIIKNNKFDNGEIKEWKELCINEAVRDGLIKKNWNLENIEDKTKVIKKIALTILISTIAFCGLYFANPEKAKKMENTDNKIKVIEEYQEKEKKTEIELIMENAEYAKLYAEFLIEAGPVFILGYLIIIPIIILFAIPIYKICRYKFSKKMFKNKYERARKGKVLVEQIAGIKNYIHDFSLLSDKEKESVIIWNEFLIYAIVLEENEKIIKDISKSMNLDNILAKFNEFLSF